MPIPDGRLFRNPSRKAIRLLLILAAIFLAVGLPPVLFITHLGIVKGQPMTDFQGACMLCMAIGLPLGVAMLLSALLTIPTARQTDRHLSEFLSGHFLADWTYTPEQWSAFVRASENAARFHRAFAWIYPGIFMVPSVAVGLFIAWMARLRRLTASCFIACSLWPGRDRRLRPLFRTRPDLRAAPPHPIAGIS